MAAHLVGEVTTGPAVHSTAVPPKSGRSYNVAFWLLLLSFEIFVLSLPLFPTGDSGLHIYYATIFRDLVTHRSALYAHVYTIRHVVQPYLLHYYAFIGLCSFLAPDAAEKILVMVVLATMALGFRSLVRALSPQSPGVALLIFPFLLNWPLAMGGLNNDFALGLMMFALALYERFPRAGSARPQLWRFTGLLILLVLSHPVPLLLLVGFLALDLLLRTWEASGRGGLTAPSRARLLAFGMACVALLVPTLLADKGEVGKSVNQIFLHRQYFHEIVNASRLCMFFVPGWLGRIYNKAFFLMYPAALAVVVGSGFFPRLRRRRLTCFDRLAIFSILLAAAILFAPEELNGSGFFAARLWLPCWLLGIAACSGAVLGVRPNRVAAAYATFLAVLTLAMAQVILRPVAVRSAEIEHAPLPTGQRGLYVQSISGQKAGLIDMNYPVYWWNGGRAFITHNDVMLNSAWLYLTIAPVTERGHAGLTRDFTERTATENPNTLASYLNMHPAQQTRALHDADFIFFVDPRPLGGDVTRVMRLALEPHMVEWKCTVSGYYALCTKKAPAAG